MCSYIMNLFNCNNTDYYNTIYEQKKYGIVIGINYNKNITYNLESVDNDINNIYKLLIKNDYLKENIYILKNPNKNEIFDLFKKIVNMININDYIFFYFSGHGIEDGLLININEENNEIVINNNNLLFNFEIRNYLIDKLPKNVFLFGLIDSCHSENNFNLPYYYFNDKWKKNNKYGKTLCNVVMISACMKNQVTHIKYINKKYESFFTVNFCDIINDSIDISWYDLIVKIKYSTILNNYNQTPIFSSSDILNINNSVYL